jgi:hypothetical protein
MSAVAVVSEFKYEMMKSVQPHFCSGSAPKPEIALVDAERDPISESASTR